MYDCKVIATIHNDYKTKFGIPRQSGLAEETRSKIVFEKEYRDPSALKGIEGFSHLWLIWYFSENKKQKTWSPTVRPPRLGGNTRMGVFATRSPYRPNPIGLSVVLLDGVEKTQDGYVLWVKGADLLDGTPVLDIKPYLPFADRIPNATGGFAEPLRENKLTVRVARELLSRIPQEKQNTLLRILEEDPRPSYQHDDRTYSFEWAEYKIRFTVTENILTVTEILFLV